MVVSKFNVVYFQNQIECETPATKMHSNILVYTQRAGEKSNMY